MEININIEIDGVKDFCNIFNTKDILNREDIVKLFNKKSYEKLVELFGKNVGLREKEQWIDLFYKAYEIYLDKSKHSNEKDPIASSIIKSVIWSLNNIEKLDSHINRIKRIIISQNFIKKALKYLPDINKDIEINIKLYIFMYNACVEGRVMLLDVSFATLFNDEQLEALLAHETHHYLKENIQKIEKGYEEVGRSLFALENEGMADMCSFEEISFIYEYFGFMKKDMVKVYLENPVRYIKEFSNKLRDRIVLNKDVKLHEYLMEEQIVHPLGYTMGKYIESVMGIDELKDCVGKPLDFILKYHYALKQETNEELLDRETIEKLMCIYGEDI
ncbi:MAG: DUF5700 domain-containing putative Zn-dependent protease [Senegalia sp. (in: firmicutes)]|uniref:DUF5700 domain-containing putative Zn-dependent protease n=1 Tax=Senegalia sp. (in: firmicutes) TaxID=1924098 RepID=UPI003F9AEFA0